MWQQKLIKVKDSSSDQYSINKNVGLKTSMLRSDLCDYSDAYIVVKERITVEGDNDDKTKNKKLIFNNISLFRLCISKINTTFLGNAEDLDIVIPMYNLLEYNENYSVTSGSLWNYCSDEINDDANENDNAGIKMNSDKTIKIKSFQCKTKILTRTSDDIDTADTEVVVPLKHLSNFWRSLDYL